jgi:hypothetical protein
MQSFFKFFLEMSCVRSVKYSAINYEYKALCRWKLLKLLKLLKLSTYQYTPHDGRVAAETYVGLIEQKYENKSAFIC